MAHGINVNEPNEYNQNKLFTNGRIVVGQFHGLCLKKPHERLHESEEFFLVHYNLTYLIVDSI